MATYLEQYLRGGYEDVWHELVSMGENIRTEPLLADARAVAFETMRRVRHNLEVLISRMKAIGYVFSGSESSDDDLPPPIMPPKDDAAQRVADLTALVGSIPLSLEAFYLVVGSVNFIGHRIDWNRLQLDPIFMLPVEITLQLHREALRNLDLETEQTGSDSRYNLLSVSFDDAAKYDEGGGTYDIMIPCWTIDTVLRGEPGGRMIVEYLRDCLQWAGLPGLRSIQELHEVVDQLTSGLLPL